MTSRRAYRSDLSDARWALIEPMLSAWRAARTDTGLGLSQPTHDLREIVNAIVYVNRTGIAWEYLPHDFPPYKTVYDYYAKWEKDGTTAAASNFTIQATDSSQATASQAFALTINPAAAIQTLSPSSANAGLSLQVSITGSYTHFVQGTTVASFGPGIAVGGAAAGQPGPVTVASPTSPTAEIAIGASAAPGSQTVTVTTGAEQATLANGFTIQAAIPYI